MSADNFIQQPKQLRPSAIWWGVSCVWVFVRIYSLKKSQRINLTLREQIIITNKCTMPELWNDSNVKVKLDKAKSEALAKFELEVAQAKYDLEITNARANYKAAKEEARYNLTRAQVAVSKKMHAKCDSDVMERSERFGTQMHAKCDPDVMERSERLENDTKRGDEKLIWDRSLDDYIKLMKDLGWRDTESDEEYHEEYYLEVDDEFIGKRMNLEDITSELKNRNVVIHHNVWYPAVVKCVNVETRKATVFYGTECDGEYEELDLAMVMENREIAFKLKTFDELDAELEAYWSDLPEKEVLAAAKAAKKLKDLDNTSQR